VTGFCASGEASCSVSAVDGCCSVALGAAVDPGGQVIQHSAAAGRDRNANPQIAAKLARKRKVVLIVRPPSFPSFHAIFRACFIALGGPVAWGNPHSQSLAFLFGRMRAAKRRHGVLHQPVKNRAWVMWNRRESPAFMQHRLKRGREACEFHSYSEAL
jgi:hypothetical protein